MRSILYLAAAFLLVSSCSLSSSQEAHLNKEFNRYIDASNTGIMLEAVGLSHPDVVRFYRAQGDSVFMKHFTHGLSEDEEKGDFIEDPIYRETREDQQIMHRKYELKFFDSETMINPKYVIFAISEDGGDNWFFVRSEDYYNKEIKGFKRLFD